MFILAQHSFCDRGKGNKFDWQAGGKTLFSTPTNDTIFQPAEHTRSLECILAPGGVVGVGWGWKETRSKEGGVQFYRGSDSGLKCVMAYSHNMARYLKDCKDNTQTHTHNRLPKLAAALIVV